MQAEVHATGELGEMTRGCASYNANLIKRQMHRQRQAVSMSPHMAVSNTRRKTDDSLQFCFRPRIEPFSVLSLAAFVVGTVRVNSTSFTVRFALNVRLGNGPVTLPSLPSSGNTSRPFVVNLVSGILLLLLVCTAKSPQAKFEVFWSQAYAGRPMTGLRLS